MLPPKPKPVLPTKPTTGGGGSPGFAIRAPGILSLPPKPTWSSAPSKTKGAPVLAEVVASRTPPPNAEKSKRKKKRMHKPKKREVSDATLDAATKERDKEPFPQHVSYPNKDRLNRATKKNAHDAINVAGVEYTIAPHVTHSDADFLDELNDNFVASSHSAQQPAPIRIRPPPMARDETEDINLNTIKRAPEVKIPRVKGNVSITRTPIVRNSIREDARSQTLPFFTRDYLPVPHPDSFPKPPDYASRALSNTFMRRSNPLHKELFKSYEVGPFSQRERRAIKAAVIKYLDLHGIDQKHAYDFVKNRKSGEYGDHKRFYPDLIAISGVNRTCRQVYTYVVDVALNDNQERAGESWTIEDDVQLLELVQLKGHSWSKIEDELARVGAKERYRHLQSISEPLVTTGSWTREEEDSLVRLLVQHHKPDRTSTVPAPPPPPRLWFLLANELKTRNFWQIRDKFNNTGVKARWWAAALAVREEEMGASEGVDKADGEDRMNALVQDSRKIDLEWTRELDKKLLQGLKSQRTAHDETEISWKPFLHGPLAVWPLARIKDRWISLRNYVQLHAQRLASANEAASSVPGTMRKCILYCLKHYDEMAGSSEGVLDRSKMLVGVRSNLSQEFVVESEEEGERGLDAEGDDKTGEKRKEDKKNAKKAKRVIGLAEKGSRAMEKADGEVDMKSKRKKRKHMDAVDGGDGSKHVISVGEMKQSKKKRTSLIDEGSVNAKKEWDEEEVVEADQVTSYREVSRGKKGKT